MVELLIVDDHELVRAGLKLILSDSEKYTVVGECDNGNQALEYLSTNHVDIILMDINMPEMDGISCTAIIKERYENIKVLAITMHNEEQHIKSMLKAGASGYLLKNSSKEVFNNALDSVMANKNYYSPGVTDVIMEELANYDKDTPDKITITQREIDVLKLIVQEKSNYEIADELFISIRTVDAHRRNLLEKTGAKNSVGLTKYAFKHNLIDKG